MEDDVAERERAAQETERRAEERLRSAEEMERRVRESEARVQDLHRKHREARRLLREFEIELGADNFVCPSRDSANGLRVVRRCLRSGARHMQRPWETSGPIQAFSCRYLRVT
jgi:hypothetical protein